MNDWVMVWQHNGQTTQLPKIPRYVYDRRWKMYLVWLLKKTLVHLF